MRNRSDRRIAATAGIISRHPREAVGLLALACAVMTIFVNALFMQHGRHPAPIFATRPPAAHAPITHAPMTHAPMSQFVPQARPLIPAVPAPRPRVETVAARPGDPIAALLAPSNRVLVVQQVLSQYGYGQIRPTGIMGPETAEAIRKFERSQHMAVTGQASDALANALSQMSGRKID